MKGYSHRRKASAGGDSREISAAYHSEFFEEKEKKLKSEISSLRDRLKNFYHKNNQPGSHIHSPSPPRSSRSASKSKERDDDHK